MMHPMAQAKLYGDILEVIPNKESVLLQAPLSGKKFQTRTD
jgi:hypothetical protein